MGSAAIENSPVLGPSQGKGLLCALEDDPDYFQALEKEVAPYSNVRRVSNHAGALEAAKDGCRLFFLDIHLGEADPTGGLTALSEIKGHFPEAFCVLLTASNQYRQEASHYQCDYYRVKSNNFCDDVKAIIFHAFFIHVSPPQRKELKGFWPAALLDSSGTAPPAPLHPSPVHILSSIQILAFRFQQELTNWPANDTVFRQMLHWASAIVADPDASEAMVLIASCIGNALKHAVSRNPMPKGQANDLDSLARMIQALPSGRELTFQEASRFKFQLEDDGGYDTSPATFQNVFESLMDLALEDLGGMDGDDHGR